MKERYWSLMTQKKFALLYLGCHLHKCVLIERWTNIILAVISTGSLAGLIFNENARVVLTCILAITQVFTAAKPYLPYEKRLRELDKGIPLLTMVYMEMEKDWNRIFDEEPSEDEINKIYYKHAKKWEEVDSDILKGDVLQYRKKYESLAHAEKEKYFKNMFGGQ